MDERHNTLKVEAAECARSANSMDKQIQELMTQLQNEIKEKEQLKSELKSEKELSQQYKSEKDLLTISLEETSEKLIATQLAYDLQAQSSLQLAQQLKEQEEMFEACQSEKS